MELEELITPPARLGFHADRIRKIDLLLEQGLADRLYTSAVYMVLRKGKIAARGAFGIAQPDAVPIIPTTDDTLFDLASVTKPFTATLLLHAVEQGRIHLDQHVADFLPEASGTPAGSLPLRRLATHTSGLPAWKPLYKTPGRAIAEILSTPLQHEPGTHYVYSDLGYILLGEILARVTGMELDHLAREWIFAPLGMSWTGYNPDPSLRPITAATANCAFRPGKILVGEVHDANAFSMNGVAGHAGLFSTAGDLARFALGFLSPHVRHGRSSPEPVLGIAAQRLVRENQAPPKVGGHSIGWFTVPNGMLPRGDLLSNRTFGHTGFTGTLLMFDPVFELAMILLTNRVYQTGEGSGVLRLRRLFANAVAGSLTD